jgi:hypothetical protein
MRLTPRPGVRPGTVWVAIATRQVEQQINALSFGSVVDHMNPWDVEAVQVPAVPDEDAAEAERAWHRFAEGAVAVSAAVNHLQSFLASQPAARHWRCVC